MRALVITADNLTAAIMRDLLTDLGVAATVRPALPPMDDPTPLDSSALAIVDWKVAGAGAFCETIAGDPTGPAPVLMVVSRQGDPAAHNAALAAGADDVIGLAMNQQCLADHLLAAITLAATRAPIQRRGHSVRHNDTRLRLLLQYAPDVITVLAPDGGILYESPSVTRLLGYPDGSLIGENAFTFVHADDIPGVQAAFRSVLEHPAEPVRSRFRFRHQDGSWRWLETVGVNALDDPSVSGIIVNSRDVTDALVIHEQLEDSVARYRDLFASAARHTQELELLERVRVALAREMDLQVVIRTAVEAAAEAFGYRLVSIYLLDGDYLHLQHQRGYDQVITRTTLTKSICGRVVRTGDPLLLKDAHADPDFQAAIDGLVSEVCVPIRDQGTVVGVLNVESSDGMTLDEEDLRLTTAVSEHVGIAVTRARLFDEARISDARFHAAFSHAPTGMALVRAGGQVLQANRALAEMLGRDLDELLATDVFAFIRSHDHAQLRRRIERLRSQQSSNEQVELVMAHSTGRKLWANIGISCVRGIDGNDDYFILQVEDTSERKALLARLEHQATHDPLTSLPNRTNLANHVDQALTVARDGGARFGLLLIDLDGFKLINDSFGHEAGDEFLIAAARRLKNALRGDDFIARLGGDEFAVLLHDVSAATDAERAADRLLQAMKAAFRINGDDAFISASIGITTGTGDHESTAAVMRQVDIALYRAKDAGRGTFVTFHPRMTAPVPSGLTLERQLQEAISSGRVEVAYQPQIDLRTGLIAGVEALARVADADNGRYLPGDFLPLAEQTGLIVPIGWEVLERACADWSTWPMSSQSDAPVLTVNFSAQQLQQAEIEVRIASALERTGMDPAMLQIEVPERSWTVDPGAASDVIDRLRALGIRFAIDDFGAEIASLLHLLTPRVDALSISPALLTTFRGQRGGLGFVRSLGTLAHERGLVLTAKAIETQTQLASARSLEIDRGQGYYLAPPMSSSQLGALLGDEHRVAMDEMPLHLVRDNEAIEA